MRSFSLRPCGRVRPLCAATIAIFVALGFSAVRSDGQTTGMVEFFSSGRLQRGLALVELTQETVVLGQDGQLHSLDPRVQDEVRSVSGSYVPLSPAELRNHLNSEFGSTFEVVATRNFLVVQPKGRGNRWPDMFEQSHRSFTAYMSKRGVDVREGRFPMVAIVFPDQRAMYAEFKKQKIDLSRVSGVYSNNSNRVLTHDGGHLSAIAATVRHEAAHQSAFNSGVHSRLSDTPRWITEGIGQMFEPAAMAAAQSGSSVRERVNLDSMHVISNEFGTKGDVNFDRGIAQLIGDNELFNSERTIDQAYALSWAMMFYLAEREPVTFAKILNFTAKRPPFRDYEKADRIRDFEQLVGVSVYEFSRRLRRYLQAI